MRFWDVIKEVSTQSVQNEARRVVVLAVAGEAEAVTAAREAVLAGATPDEAAAAEPFLLCVSPPYTPEQEMNLRHADLLISLPGGPRLTEFRPADILQVETADRLVRLALLHRPDLRVPLARRLPGFRELAAEFAIRDVSRANAEFAAVSTVGSVIPGLAFLFPAAAFDILMLTKNQVLLLFRLAAIYGEDVNIRARVGEILPVLGGALGWRTLARELAGALPGAIGLPVRAGIAYTGTYVAGRAAQLAFDEGRRPTRQEMLRLYEEAGYLAKGVVAALKDRLLRRPPPPPPPALPPGPAALPEGAVERSGNEVTADERR
jgi:uncharacterized protein (DUF697 family)